MSRVDGPAPTVYLHIGPPKTGTSFVQDTLLAWHEELRAVGIHYPTKPPHIHFHAALDARGNLGHGIEVGEEHERTQAAGAWSDLVASVKASDAVSIISHEVFSSADEDHARRAVRDLRDIDLHLVVTARDPARQIMSAWQQRIRQGSTRTFATVASAMRRRGKLAPGQDLPGLLDRWGRDLAPDHVHVVTVPPTGSDPAVLWQRFAKVVGIDAQRFDTSRTERVNESLSWTEAETLRRVNLALDGRVTHPYYYETVGQFFSRDVLSGLSNSPKAQLPSDLGPLVDEIAERWIEELGSRGYDIVGDLDDLRPRVVPGEVSRPKDAAIAEVSVKAAADVLVEFARLYHEANAPGAVERLKRSALQRLRQHGLIRQRRM
jgi:hypothetical protein